MPTMYEFRREGNYVDPTIVRDEFAADIMRVRNIMLSDDDISCLFNYLIDIGIKLTCDGYFNHEDYIKYKVTAGAEYHEVMDIVLKYLDMRYQFVSWYASGKGQ